MKHFINIAFYLTFGTVYGQTLVVLGTLQDGGSPHMNCEKSCCAAPKRTTMLHAWAFTILR